MRLLLDTHTLLWFVEGSARLSSRARSLIEDPSSQRLFSVAGLWEIAIKSSIGKLALALPFDAFVSEQVTGNGIDLLPITANHIATVAALPLHHGDPFDRLLIAQSIVEGLPLISADTAFDAYPVERLW